MLAEKVILAVGTSYKIAPLEAREAISFATPELEEALLFLSRYVGQGTILSTCNRSEIYALAEEPERGYQRIKHFLTDYHHASAASFSGYLRTYVQEEAVSHLFKVASGMDSMIIGEEQILGQVRKAWELARSTGCAGHRLSRLFHRALQVGNRVRSETQISRYAPSVSQTALEVVKRATGSLDSRSMLLIGAGETGELTAKIAKRSQIDRLTVTSRTYEKAQALAQRIDGRAVPIEELTESMVSSDIVISSTSAEGFVLGPEEIRKVMQQRDHHPLLLIDIAIPRDIDPEVANIDNVFLYNIDTLRSSSTFDPEQSEVAKAEAIINSEVTRFMEWWHGLESVPTITALRAKAEAIRQKELAKTLSKMPQLEEVERDRINALTKAITNKILHHPIISLKTRNEEYLQIVRQLFDL